MLSAKQEVCRFLGPRLRPGLSASWRFRQHGGKVAGNLPPTARQSWHLANGPCVAKRTTEEAESPAETTSETPVLIGVVASAGGLAALKSMCGELDQLVGASMIIAQHVSPTHHSQLPELLAACTECPVQAAKSGIKPEPGNIYVIPPDRDAVVQSGVIRLRKPDPDSSAHPSGDRLLLSLASTCEDRCVAVILSGTGQDGSTGAKAVKAAGGIVLVQDPDTAQYDGMPRAAIRTGCADSVGTPAEIGRRLDTIGRGNGGLLLPDLPNRDLDDDYIRVCRIVRRRTGVRLDNYKRGTVLRRIRRRIGMSTTGSLEEYCDLLETDDTEAKQLASDVLIPVTAFFRDTGAFKSMAKAVEELVSNRPTGDMIRCWVAGCATGEEAYSLAILLAEACRGKPNAPDFMIFVSDLKREAVDIARRGIYSAAALDPIPKDLRDRYFEHTSDEYYASKQLRRRMVFATQNLIDDPPFSRMDMITCRNVLIYFSPESQRRVLGIFHYALNKDGILFLGKSETPDKYGELYSVVDARARIYRRVEGARAEDTQMRSAFDPTPRTPVTKRERSQSQAETLSHGVHAAAVKLFAPPCVIVDDGNRPVHVIGDVTPFVGLPSGPTQWSVFDLLASPIVAEVRAMVFRCRSEGNSVEGGTYSVERDGKSVLFSPSVHQTTINDQRFVLIAFHVRENRPYDSVASGDDPSGAIANELERELATTRLHLQTVLEEVESANEELQSLNEELQSSNEELQSTNEELQTSNEEMQSTNEELMTVNDELAVKSDELAHTARDLELIKETLNFPLIVLDENRRVRRYNNAASSILELDSLKDSNNIRSAVWIVNFKGLSAALGKLTSNEEQASVSLDSEDGRTWQVHSSRYKDDQQASAGHVITFLEISDERRTARALADREAYYRVAFEHSAVAMIITEADGKIRSANTALSDLVGISSDELAGKPLHGLFGKPQKTSITDTLKSLREDTTGAKRLEAEIQAASSTPRWVSITMAATSEIDGTAPHVITQIVDIDPAKRRERKLSEEFTRLRLISELSRMVATDTPVDEVIQQAVSSLSVVFDDCRVAYATITPHYAAITARARPEGAESVQAITIHGRQRDKFAQQVLMRSRSTSTLDHDVIPWSLLAPEQVIGASLDVAVIVHDELVGVLSLQSETEREWTQFEYSTLAGAADLVSLTFRNESDDQQRTALMQALSDEKERVEVTLRSIGDGVITTDLEGRVEYMNPTAEDIIGTSLDKAQGKSLFNVYRVVRGTDQRPLPNPIELCLRTKDLVEDTDPDAILISESGLRVPVDHSAAPIQDSHGEMTGAVLVFRDVSDERMLARELSYKATHDALTGLVNRSEFERRLHQLILGASRHHESHVMCFVDLDRFKLINDTCGHAAGDELLKQLAELLSKKLRRSDMLARLGGDEFGILLEHCSVERAMQISKTVITALNELTFKWHGRTFSVGASIGIVTIDDRSTSIPTVMSQADTACYSAKQRGRNQVCVYDSADMAQSQRHDETDLLARITEQLEHNGFVFFTEPVVRCDTRATSDPFYYELTLRMPSGDGPPMPASEFLPAAERYFLMTAIDRWVVRHAIQQVVARSDTVQRVGINLSGQSLGDATFTGYVLETIESIGVDPRRLVFEITESAAVSYISEAVRFIKALKKLGCRFALDDFGTGMSSFAYLRDLPVDLLKIDKRFVQACSESPVDRALVEAQVNIARELGIETIAEGVETPDQATALLELGVTYQQGFLLANPTPLNDL